MDVFATYCFSIGESGFDAATRWWLAMTAARASGDICRAAASRITVFLERIVFSSSSERVRRSSFERSR